MLALSREPEGSARTLGVAPLIQIIAAAAVKAYFKINWEVGMSRALILGAVLFAGLLMNSSWAQNKGQPQASGPPYPGTSEMSFQWRLFLPKRHKLFIHLPGRGRSKPCNEIDYLLGDYTCWQ